MMLCPRRSGVGCPRRWLLSAVDSQAAWIDDFEIGKWPCHHHVQQTEVITSERDGYIV